MDRLGGFRLCRRLRDMEERLPPFLSAKAMVSRGLGQRQEGHHERVEKLQEMRRAGTTVPGQAAQGQNQPT
jgi:hypothetical protein